MKTGRLRLSAILLLSLWIAFPPAAEARLPADPFERVLYRLDHAPFDLADLDKQTEKSREVEAAAGQFAAIMGPVTPMLQGLASCKTLSFLGQLPYLGQPVEAIRLGLQGTVEAGRGFQWLVDTEARTLQPESRAIRACAQLQRSRSRTDLPEMVTALHGALGPLDASDTALRVQDGRVRRLAATLAQLGPILDQLGNAQGRGQNSLSQAASQLAAMSALLQSAQRPVHSLRLWARRCSEDGQLALAAGENTPADGAAASADGRTPQGGNENGRTGAEGRPGYAGNGLTDAPSSSRLLAYVFLFIALLGFAFTFYLWKNTRRNFASRVHPVNGPSAAAEASPVVVPLRAPVAALPPRTTAWLETGDGSGTWRHHPLKADGKVFIGRLSAADLRLDDEQVSGLHAAVEGREGRFSILDLDSSNGAHVNGLRVVNVPLQDRDIIQVGETRITFRQSASP